MKEQTRNYEVCRGYFAAQTEICQQRLSGLMLDLYHEKSVPPAVRTVVVIQNEKTSSALQPGEDCVSDSTDPVLQRFLVEHPQ